MEPPGTNSRKMLRCSSSLSVPCPVTTELQMVLFYSRSLTEDKHKRSARLRPMSARLVWATQLLASMHFSLGQASMGQTETQKPKTARHIL